MFSPLKLRNTRPVKFTVEVRKNFGLKASILVIISWYYYNKDYIVRDTNNFYEILRHSK